MSTLVITIISLCAIGVVSAVILYFVAQKFKVEEDPRIDIVEGLLPGVTTPSNSSMLVNLIVSPLLLFIFQNLLRQIFISHRYFSIWTMAINTFSFRTCFSYLD